MTSGKQSNDVIFNLLVFSQDMLKGQSCKLILKYEIYQMTWFGIQRKMQYIVQAINLSTTIYIYVINESKYLNLMVNDILI